MNLRNLIVKYNQVLVVLLTILFCMFVLIAALAWSQREQPQFLGTVFDDRVVGSQNHRLFANEYGGFFLVSGEPESSVLTELGQSGDVPEYDGVPAVEWAEDLSYYQAFQRGNWLFLIHCWVDPESVDQSYSLAALDMKQDSPFAWSEHSKTTYIFPGGEISAQQPISFTADSRGIFYLTNPAEGNPDRGSVFLFALDDLEYGQLTRPPERLSLEGIGIEKIVTTPDDALYLFGMNQEDKIAVWWMELYPETGKPEDTLTQIAEGESLAFPVDFVNESLMVGEDGSLYQIQEDHSFTPLPLTGELPPQTGATSPVRWEAVMSQTSTGTILVKSDNNVIAEYDLQNLSQPVALYVFDGEVVSFASNSGDTMVLLHSDVGYSRILLSTLPRQEPVLPSSMPEPSLPEESEIPSGSSEISSGSSEILSEPAAESSQVSSSAQEETPSEIISDTFQISEQGYIVVPPGTTVAQLKKTIPVGVGRLETRKIDGMVYASGKLGTGMTITLYDSQNHIRDLLEVMVPGDLNGSTTVNTRDEAILYQHLLGEEELIGVYWAAADFNHDGVVDLLDLVLLKQQME